MGTARGSLVGLRHDIATIVTAERAIETVSPQALDEGRFPLGLPALDTAIGGGLRRAALHEIFAASAGDAAATRGFGLALTACAAAYRPIIWVRQDMVAQEQGELHAPGLQEFGLPPEDVVLLRMPDALQALRAGHEALRCQAPGVVVVELWGAPKALDLTASQRLNRAAAKAGVTALLIRSGTGATPQPSAALTRWSVCAAPSSPLAAGAPGAPAFEIGLLLHREGYPPQTFRVEWNRDDRAFRKAALSRPVAASSGDRPPASPVRENRPAGWNVVPLQGPFHGDSRVEHPSQTGRRRAAG
ncbi:MULTISPECIES: hypothetical protein [unclassified Chelatococcus]|jgi:protein ImuA|uniref:ImuA family protein n=1 Tax=unclassified Chelatococcus TaxID=2638111 RepID=UPI001BD10095|nr:MULTISPECIES: hypothetical protein [unclassified Chelatococcus]CAH1671097.1 Protein ImuA [Hyphomicrobiales bacterium]MBS7738421.1 hypothetical protein [Chelatococcus sp. HY11]MBX3542825.1 hypothetical protein [Chelatococcus sp.]MCO5077049.1 hypothetical protein [Chelatococcus sp.]CAH1676687.1 Protein ImuA [Hyphomicrobiales bacterium]